MCTVQAPHHQFLSPKRFAPLLLTLLFYWSERSKWSRERAKRKGINDRSYVTSEAPLGAVLPEKSLLEAEAMAKDLCH